MSKLTLKFVEKLEDFSPRNPVKLTFRYGSDHEVEIIAEDGYGNKATMLGIRGDGTVVRYIGQEAALKGMGFQTENGFVKMFN